MRAMQPVELPDCDWRTSRRRWSLRVDAVAFTAVLVALALTGAAGAEERDSPTRVAAASVSVPAATAPASVNAPPPSLPPPSEDPALAPTPPPSGEPPSALPPPSEVAPAPPPPPPAAQPVDPPAAAPAPAATPQATPPPPQAAPARTPGARPTTPAPSRSDNAAPRAPRPAATPAAAATTAVNALAAARRPAVASRAAPLASGPRRSSSPAGRGATDNASCRGGRVVRGRCDQVAPPKPALSELLPYDLRAHPQTAITLLGATFTLLLLAGSGRQLAVGSGGARSVGERLAVGGLRRTTSTRASRSSTSAAWPPPSHWAIGRVHGDGRARAPRIGSAAPCPCGWPRDRR